MKRKPNHAKERTSFSAEEIAAFNFGHLYCTIENQLNTFAAQPGCPYSLSDITHRISGLLSDKAVREEFRNTELVPEVRTNGKAARLQRAIESGTAFHVRARSSRSLNKAARKRISIAQKARWAKWNKAKQKRKPTPAQLRAYRANAILARAAQVKLRKAA